MLKKVLLISLVGFSASIAENPYSMPGSMYGGGYGMQSSYGMYGGGYNSYGGRSSGSKIRSFFSSPGCHSKYTYGKMLSSPHPHHLYLQQVYERCPLSSVSNFYRAVCQKAITPIPGRFETNPQTNQPDFSKPVKQLYLSVFDHNASICMRYLQGYQLRPSMNPKLRNHYELVSMYSAYPVVANPTTPPQPGGGVPQPGGQQQQLPQPGGGVPQPGGQQQQLPQPGGGVPQPGGQQQQLPQPGGGVPQPGGQPQWTQPGQTQGISPDSKFAEGMPTIAQLKAMNRASRNRKIKKFSPEAQAWYNTYIK